MQWQACMQIAVQKLRKGYMDSDGSQRACDCMLGSMGWALGGAVI